MLTSRIAGLAMAAMLGAAVTAALPALAGRPAGREAADQTLGMALMSATVHHDGTVIEGDGVTFAALEGLGTYIVAFSREARNCVPVANGSTAGGATGFALAQIGRNGVNGPYVVFVTTHDAAGAVTNQAFNLLVFCAD